MEPLNRDDWIYMSAALAISWLVILMAWVVMGP